MVPGFWDRGSTDPSLHLDLVNLLKLLSTTPGIGVIRNFGPGILDTDYIVIPTPSPQQPVYMRVEWEGNVAVFFCGTDFSLSQIQGLINGYSSDVVNHGAIGANGGLYNGVGSVWSGNTPTVQDSSTNLYCVGFSYGGGCAIELHALALNAAPNRKIKTFTYGSPRPGNYTFAQALGGQNIFRVWLTLDPVRYIPPHIDEVPMLAVFNPLPLVQGMDAQVQAGISIQLWFTGEFTYTASTPGPTVQVARTIFDWLMGTTGFGAPQHSLTAYQNALTLGVENFPFQRVPAAAPPPDRPLVVTNAVVAQVAARQTPLAVQAQANGQFPPVVVQVVQGTITNSPPGSPPPARYVLRKQGTIWTVQLNGQVVAAGPGKRHAKTLRRELNRALVAAGR